jgi:hypothetical protein
MRSIHKLHCRDGVKKTALDAPRKENHLPEKAGDFFVGTSCPRRGLVRREFAAPKRPFSYREKQGQRISGYPLRFLSLPLAVLKQVSESVLGAGAMQVSSPVLNDWASPRLLGAPKVCRRPTLSGFFLHPAGRVLFRQDEKEWGRISRAATRHVLVAAALPQSPCSISQSYNRPSEIRLDSGNFATCRIL